MKKGEDYKLQEPTWCPGCGLYGILTSLKRAAVALDLDPEQTVVITGIGCHGRLNSYFKSYGFHALHGRVLPVAAGIKLSNHKLDVLAVSGDGDAYSIGLNHFLHAVRRNVDITYIVVDNRIYALTQGQTSPTSERGFVSISTPYGSKEDPLSGPQLALAAGGTFVARGFSGDPGELASLFTQGMQHKGFALIEVLSPCITHNKVNTYEWFKQNVEKMKDHPDYDPKDKIKAWEKLSQGKKIPVGLFYAEERPSFEELSSLGETPLAHQDIRVKIPDLKKLLEGFR